MALRISFPCLSFPAWAGFFTFLYGYRVGFKEQDSAVWAGDALYRLIFVIVT